MRKLFSTILLMTSFLSTSIAGEQKFEDTFFNKQWGIINSGQTLFHDTGDLTREFVPGVPGVDINYVNLEGKFDKKKEVIVAVLDTGLDVNHPDFKNRVWTNDNCTDAAEGEEKIPCNGLNALDKNFNVSDDKGHGTHVAGIIAANTNNIGIAGVTPSNIKIMPIVVLSKKLSGFVYDNKYVTDIIADGVRFALEHGADVINMSLGWPKLIQTPKIDKALKVAIERNIPVIVATGNNNKNVPTFPCTMRGIICVGAVTNTGQIAGFSNHGGKVDILAPGDFIISTYPIASCPRVLKEGETDACMKKGIESRVLGTHGYESKKGTSQAAPFVTAIAAALKLKFPEITLDEVKARMFSTARSTEKSNTGKRYSKFGLIDMKRALTEKPEVFLTTDFKNLLELPFSSDRGMFALQLPVKNFIGDIKSAKVELKLDADYVKLEKTVFELKDLKAGQVTVLKVLGKVLDRTQDSSIKLSVTISSGEKFSSTTSTELVLSRILKRDRQVNTIPIQGMRASHISDIRKSSKRNFLKLVSDKYAQLEAPEYFVLERGKDTQPEDKTIITLINTAGPRADIRKLELPKQGQVLSMFRVDINMDGNLDYFIYTLDKEKVNILFHYFDKDLKPLFGDKSTWTFPVSTFEGLPLKFSYQDDFNWVKLKTEAFGNILVPAMQKAWFMPDEDNSEDILDRIPLQKDMHLYYLKPQVEDEKVVVKVRAFDNFDFYEKIKRDLRVRPKDTIRVGKPFFQSKNDFIKGNLKVLVSVGPEFRKRNYILDIPEIGTHTRKELPSTSTYLSGNGVHPVTDIFDKGNFRTASTFLALLNRHQTRIYVLDPEKVEDRPLNFEADSYNDPFFNYIAGFNNSKETLFMESRYYVYALDNEGNTEKLPVNRDSSFPGVNFSETLIPLVVNSKTTGEQLPGIFVDSTLIYGDRLYSMVKTKDHGFVRPIELSVKVPSNCVRMVPVRMGKKGIFNYSMLCKIGSTGVALKYLPIEVR